ncbi:MAG: sugar ABC transporter permease [Rhodospirillales bacterium]|nr:sugar ABC transporter permease [Rhodospirillales bacterium]
MNLLEAPMRLAQAKLRGGRIGWVFVVPNLSVFGLFTFLPILIDLVYAATGGNQLFPAQRPYVGTANFRALLACRNYLDPNTCTRDLFWHGVYNTAEFVVLQVGFMVGLSLVTALALNRPGRGRGFFRAVFFYPVLLSPVVVALIWKWVLQRYGVLNALLSALGLAPHDWLLNATTAFFWSVFVSIWAHMGFYTLILLAGLQAIPRDVYEAAAMDATPPWRRFRRITLPLLMPSLLVVLVLALIRAVQIFDEVYVLTGGGPGTSTTFLVQFIYQTGFAQQVREYGMAAAASLLLAGVLMALTVLQLRLARPKS